MNSCTMASVEWIQWFWIIGFNINPAFTVHLLNSLGAFWPGTTAGAHTCHIKRQNHLHPTGFPFIHLHGEQQCGYLMSWWRTIVAGIDRNRTRNPLIQSQGFNPIYIYRVYTVLRLWGRTPHAGSDPPFAPQCKCKSPAPIAGSDPPFVLLQYCRVWPRMRDLTPLFCVCKQKAGCAPAMYGTFPCVAREIS